MTDHDVLLADLGPVAARQLKDEAYIAIKDAITSLRLPPGAAIAESQLGRMLGTSKTPIRMALVRLENEGFVETRRASGTFVRRMTFEDVQEVFEVRLALEQLAAQLLAAQITPSQIGTLRANLDDSGRLIHGGSEAEAFGAVHDFHLLMVDFAANSLLARTYRSLFDHVVRIGNVCGRIPGRNEKSILEHRAIVDALEAQSSAQATERIAAHLSSLLADYRNVAETNALFAPIDGEEPAPLHPGSGDDASLLF